jgi:hypothetical protein
VSNASDGATAGKIAVLRDRASAVEQIAMSKRAREKARRMNASGEEKEKITQAREILQPFSSNS